MPRVLFVGVVEGTCAGPGDRSDAGTYRATGEGTDSCPARRSNTDSLDRVNVALVPDSVPIPPVMVAHSSYGRYSRGAHQKRQAQTCR